MPLVSLVLALVLVGLLLYLVGLIPLDPTIHQLIRVVVIVAVVFWLILHLLPVGGLGSFRIGH
jgi:uncharacterized membrane protein